MKIIVANWKMNHDFDKTDQWLDSFFSGYSADFAQFKNITAIVCPPNVLLDHIDSEMISDSFQYLEEVIKQEGKTLENYSEEQLHEIIFEMRPILIGAQDCHHEISGSFTGDVSAAMLKNLGCSHVILGHSERRAGHFESNAIVNRKALAAVVQGLTPIICVGESKEIRDQNQHVEFVRQQLLESLSQDVKFKKLVIAYEPIWSIGTGIVPTMAQIGEMTKIIRDVLATSFSNRIEEFFVIYGGSVTAENSGEILQVPGVDGLLVGKASLDAAEFLKICSSAFES